MCLQTVALDHSPNLRMQRFVPNHTASNKDGDRHQTVSRQAIGQLVQLQEDVQEVPTQTRFLLILAVERCSNFWLVNDEKSSER